MDGLNYHHLRHFYEVCRAGGVGRAAERLRVAASAVSVHVRLLEEAAGHPLFDRTSKSLVLTEAGALVFEYAEKIFSTGEELRRVLGGEHPERTRVLRVGVVATLSRNFIVRFLQPGRMGAEERLWIRNGGESELLAALKSHRLDVVLANAPAPRGGETTLHSDLIDEQRVSLIGHPPSAPGRRRRFRFPEDLKGRSLILPGEDSGFRQAFSRLLDAHGIVPRVVAEADDMALLRLLARELDALALLPPVVVRDELESGVLLEVCRVKELTERFFAITPQRKFLHPLVPELRQRFSSSTLAGRKKARP
jgi:LysR family transcriptional activator of nhaA